MARPGLILDRDGTVIEERGYITDPADLVVLPGVAACLERARLAGVALAIVTNQSAVGQGLVTEAGLHALHAHLAHLGIEAVYHCPHLPADGCACRKPLPGMIERAIVDLDLDPSRSLLVGDHLTDCEAGRAAGVPAVLVRTGHGREHAAEAAAAGFPVVDDLPEAVDGYLAALVGP